MEQIALTFDTFHGILERLLDDVEDHDAAEGVLSWKSANEASQDDYEREAAQRGELMVAFRYRLASGGRRISRRERLVDAWRPGHEEDETNAAD